MTTPTDDPDKTPTLTVIDHSDEYATPLATAISLWRAGERIDLTLFAELREEGYDVPSLERFYFNQSSR